MRRHWKTVRSLATVVTLAVATVSLTAGSALAGFHTLFPMADWQDYLVVDPLLAACLVPPFLRWTDREARAVDAST